MPGNLLVLQSGGCTSVMNASLAGVLRAAAASPEVGRAYGSHQGIRGVLRGEVFDLTDQAPPLDQLRRTPAALLGSARHKLTDADKGPLTQAIESTREKAKGTDAQAIKSAIEQLEAASHAFSKVLYEKGAAAGTEGGAAGTSNDIDTGPAAGAGSHTTQPKGDDDVIEGEFEVKK